MNQSVIVGLVIIAGGLVHMAMVAVSKGEPWEYMTGAAFAEIGSGIVIGSLVPPGTPRAVVAAFFFIAVASTTYMEWKGRREWRKRSTSHGS